MQAWTYLRGSEGFRPNQGILWKIDFRFRVLRPQAELRLALRDPAGHQRQLVVMAKLVEIKHVTDVSFGGADFWEPLLEMETEAHLMRIRSAEVGDELLVAKLPRFFFGQNSVTIPPAASWKRSTTPITWARIL